jgi:membrane-associated phospholipid phosphatase
MGWLALNYPDKYNHNRMVAAILAILAIGIGYSRMYLAQHSLIDVCAGGSLALILLTLSDHFGRKLNIHE